MHFILSQTNALVAPVSETAHCKEKIMRMEVLSVFSETLIITFAYKSISKILHDISLSAFDQF